jgi:hypothetical protein
MVTAATKDRVGSVIVRANNNMPACHATRPRRALSLRRPRSTKRSTGTHWDVRIAAGGAGGTRTHARRIMRSTPPCTTRASCTDDTEYRTDGTHRAGIIRRAIPRTIPRPTTASATQRYHARSELRHPERLTTAARPVVRAHRTGSPAALWPARASARTTAHACYACDLPSHFGHP